jgi:hypothetical protein
VQFAAQRVGFHPDADEVVGAVEVKSLGVSQRHEFSTQIILIHVIPNGRGE